MFLEVFFCGVTLLIGPVAIFVNPLALAFPSLIAFISSLIINNYPSKLNKYTVTCIITFYSFVMLVSLLDIFISIVTIMFRSWATSLTRDAEDVRMGVAILLIILRSVTFFCGTYCMANINQKKTEHVV